MLRGRRLRRIVVRNAALRWPVKVPGSIRNQRINAVERRAKYLLLHLDTGGLIVHLGMSGHLSVVPTGTPAAKHDHVDFELDDARCVRLTDPRRFGSLHWQPLPLEDHWLLRNLGPEPLSPNFDGGYLAARAKGRRVAVKSFLMDSRVVVGVGNIYANEALFMAGIRPGVAAGRLSRPRLAALADAIKATLLSAIQSGGTTLRDFVATDGRPGYFVQQLSVYGRGGEPCLRCDTTLKEIRQNDRTTVYCPRCQH